MREYEGRQILLPYCMDKVAEGRYILLNRRYKPLGMATDEWIEYATHPSVFAIKGLTAAKAKKLSARGEESLDRIYFYNDGCIPNASAEHWKAYSERLRLLADMTVF